MFLQDWYDILKREVLLVWGELPVYFFTGLLKDFNKLCVVVYMTGRCPMKGKNVYSHGCEGVTYPFEKKVLSSFKWSSVSRNSIIFIISIFLIFSSAGYIQAQQQRRSADSPIAPRGPEESREGFMPTEKVQQWRERKSADLMMKNVLMDNLSGRPPGPVESSPQSEMITTYTAVPPTLESPVPSLEGSVPEQETMDFNEVIEELTGESPDEIEEEMQIAPPAIVPLGPALLINKGRLAGGEAYDWLEDNVTSFKNGFRAKEFEIKVEEMPEEMRGSLEPLLEIEGVSVTVPGADYAVAGTQEEGPRMNYDVKDEIFTIDDISLEKTEEGSLVVRVPPSAEKDLEKKALCLSRVKDLEGKTVEERLREGDPATLAKVLAEGARYSAVGFKFSKEAEGEVARAVIRIMGVGMEDAVVRFEEKELKSEALEEELQRIVGDDEEAWTRIRGFIHPRVSGGRRRK